jgi:predicted nucleic acid-binding protein
MIAFDTNVLLYACDESYPQRQQTALRLIDETADGVLLWQVACEVVAASGKLSGQGFSPADAWLRLAELLDLFPLILPMDAVLQRARQMHLNEQRSFWDAMILAACLESGVTRLYSENFSGGSSPAGLEVGGSSPAGLEVVNPFV